MKIFGQEQPWTFPGPDGVVSVLGVVFEGDVATLDNGALHNRSHLEAGVRFSEDPAARGKGERATYVWVVYPGAGPAERFHAACSVELWIDRPAGKGWKRPIDHINRMTAAVRGKIDVADLSPAQRRSLAELLQALAPEAWKRSSDALRNGIAPA